MVLVCFAQPLLTSEMLVHFPVHRCTRWKSFLASHPDIFVINRGEWPLVSRVIACVCLLMWMLMSPSPSHCDLPVWSMIFLFTWCIVHFPSKPETQQNSSIALTASHSVSVTESPVSISHRTLSIALFVDSIFGLIAASTPRLQYLWCSLELWEIHKWQIYDEVQEVRTVFTIIAIDCSVATCNWVYHQAWGNTKPLDIWI